MESFRYHFCFFTLFLVIDSFFPALARLLMSSVKMPQFLSDCMFSDLILEYFYGIYVSPLVLNLVCCTFRHFNPTSCLTVLNSVYFFNILPCRTLDKICLSLTDWAISLLSFNSSTNAQWKTNAFFTFDGEAFMSWLALDLGVFGLVDFETVLPTLDWSRSIYFWIDLIFRFSWSLAFLACWSWRTYLCLTALTDNLSDCLLWLLAASGELLEVDRVWSYDDCWCPSSEGEDSGEYCLCNSSMVSFFFMRCDLIKFPATSSDSFCTTRLRRDRFFGIDVELMFLQLVFQQFGGIFFNFVSVTFLPVCCRQRHFTCNIIKNNLNIVYLVKLLLFIYLKSNILGTSIYKICVTSLFWLYHNISTLVNVCGCMSL